MANDDPTKDVQFVQGLTRAKDENGDDDDDNAEAVCQDSEVSLNIQSGNIKKKKSISNACINYKNTT